MNNLINSIPDLMAYQTIIIAFSGGKDSLACLLHLLELGVPKDRIELWHHDVDGREGSDLMDWACTREYCRKVADAFGVKIYFSWLNGGLEGEMRKKNAKKAPTSFEMPGPDGETVIKTVGGNLGKVSTRLMWPAKSPNLMVRWCSAYGKIDVGAIAINNQERFLEGKHLFITGERGEESANRAKYEDFEPHKTDRRDGKKVQRHIDQWRPVLRWEEKQVWDIIEKWSVNVHPCYRLGYGRCSCMGCIFADADQWATTRELDGEKFNQYVELEEFMGHTIDAKETITQTADKGTPYTYDQLVADHALDSDWNEDVILPEGTWTLPSGAFKKCGGPL